MRLPDSFNSIATIGSTQMSKRELATGAKAGLGIGIAVAVIIVGLIVTFFIVHVRHRTRNQAMDRERAVIAEEKNVDGSVKRDTAIPEPAILSIPRRNKSVKDRLMGPLYRGSMIDLPTMPRRTRQAGVGNRESTMTVSDGDSMISRPWTSTGNSPRASFSSKRATRMMMMM